jgi:Chitobiase/beta-hexosaminidase C-terminal domain
MSTKRLTRRGGAALVASAGLAASALAALPASATIQNVEAGHNVTVFHNIDFVAVSGWDDGESVTVNVFRGGALIGTATGDASDPEATGSSGLEVNHGPEGAPVAGDCWVGHTPDIRPGDRITVSNGTLTDSVIVDNIAFTGRPRALRNGDIVVPFVAKRFNGDPIPVGLIDSAEFRAAANNSVRFEGNRVVVERRPGAAPGQYWSRYRAPFRPSRNDSENPFNQAQLRRALLGDGHAVGYGHLDPVPAEAMLHDGLDDTPGPAPGCEDAPSAQWTANATPGAINSSNLAGGLQVSGLAQDAQSVRVTLTDSDPATAAAPVKVATLSNPDGRQRWTADFTAAQLRGLTGRIRAAVQFTMADGAFTRSTSVVKDLVAPKAPQASLRSGTYSQTKRVALRSAAGNQIRYTLGNGRQARPTRNSGTVYRGNRIRISATQTLKMIAVDPAGNVSALAKRRYVIR